MLTSNDLKQLNERGITEESINAQIDKFKNGFPFLKLYSAASPQKGIFVPTEADFIHCTKAWERYLQTGHKIVKFVPASGAASRMFKNLFEYIDNDSKDISNNEYISTFFNNIENFAFYDDLNDICKENEEKGISEHTSLSDKKKVIHNLLDDNGLRYGKLPKGLLKFHKYKDGNRTPLEEHLVEGALYARGNENNVNICFTVSPEHHILFEKLIEIVKEKYEKLLNVKFNIVFTEQKSSTDTVAVNSDNTPFRTSDGSLLFRPGGHGALIENLNDIDADIVFIKNIDNIVPDKHKDETVIYKKLLAGALVRIQHKVFEYLELLESGAYTHAQLDGIIRFMRDDLSILNPDLKTLEDKDLAHYLKNKLNRPIRVCGMVKNVGEPGGGPFLAYNNDGTISPQILESSQIDKGNNNYVKMFKEGTHFNPVDLVCSLKDYKGKKFDLTKYVDSESGFISHKSKDGKELKALELPGLWNGAMSDWITVFIEVPLSTFNPVKTVNDLLRDYHQ